MKTLTMLSSPVQCSPGSFRVGISRIWTGIRNLSYENDANDCLRKSLFFLVMVSLSSSFAALPSISWSPRCKWNKQWPVFSAVLFTWFMHVPFLPSGTALKRHLHHPASAAHTAQTKPQSHFYQLYSEGHAQMDLFKDHTLYWASSSHSPPSSGGPTQVWVRARKGFSCTFAPAKMFIASSSALSTITAFAASSPHATSSVRPVTPPSSSHPHEDHRCSWTQLLCMHASSDPTQGKRGNQSLRQRLTLKQLTIKSGCFPPDPLGPFAVLFWSCFCFVSTMLPTNWLCIFTL